MRGCGRMSRWRRDFFSWARATEEARDGVTFTHMTEEVQEMYPDVPYVWALAFPFALSSSVNTD